MMSILNRNFRECDPDLSLSGWDAFLSDRRRVCHGIAACALAIGSVAIVKEESPYLERLFFAMPVFFLNSAFSAMYSTFSTRSIYPLALGALISMTGADIAAASNDSVIAQVGSLAAVALGFAVGLVRCGFPADEQYTALPQNDGGVYELGARRGLPSAALEERDLELVVSGLEPL